VKYYSVCEWHSWDSGGAELTELAATTPEKAAREAIAGSGIRGGDGGVTALYVFATERINEIDVNGVFGVARSEARRTKRQRGWVR
jgi:hypothetical protein